MTCQSRFPWESARTGVDVTPDCCPEVRLYQMHITGDIAFAARQYIAATGNRDWLLDELGGDLIYEIARFWGSRAVYSNEKKQYEILSKLYTITCLSLALLNTIEVYMYLAFYILLIKLFYHLMKMLNRLRIILSLLMR
jgi:hypothetical protein